MERTLLIGAHPDDIETMFGFYAMRCGELYTLVATAGTQGENRTGDPDFVRRGLRIPLESVPGLMEVGVPLRNQYYSRDLLQEDEPEPQDSALWASKETLSRQTVEIVTIRDITHIVSQGEQGYDGHPDHIDAHDATIQAVKLLRALGQNVVHLAINASHSGTLELKATEEEAARKLRARAHHRSQRPVFGQASRCHRYQLLLSRETYDMLAA